MESSPAFANGIVRLFELAFAGLLWLLITALSALWRIFPYMLPLVVVIGAFWIMLRPLPGVKELEDGIAASGARGVAWVFGTVWRFSYVIIFTTIDGIISLAHAAISPLKVKEIWFDFLQRLNDRLYKLLIR